MAKSRNLFLTAAALFLGLLTVSAEEAIDLTGVKHRGQLQEHQGAWIFRTSTGESIPLKQLAYVRFASEAPGVSRVPLTHSLHLPSGQHLTGTLVQVGDKVDFVASWGQAVTLDRAQVVGIEQANDSLAVVHESFETTLKSWRVQGKPTLSGRHLFCGKTSLLLDGPGQSITRDWPAIRSGSIQLFVFESELIANLTCTIEAIPDSPQAKTPALVINATGYSAANLKKNYGPIQAKQGWHALQIQWGEGRMRMFVDDLCLGETPANFAIQGIRIATEARIKDSGSLWLDELLVTRRIANRRRPAPLKDQDTVWLEHDEQLFGRIVSADGDKVVLDAKFGQRSYPWSGVRGIFFAYPKDVAASSQPVVEFRPGPGFPLDSLRAKLLRWDGDKLFVHHDSLGEIAIERNRLEKAWFAVK